MLCQQPSPPFHAFKRRRPPYTMKSAWTAAAATRTGRTAWQLASTLKTTSTTFIYSYFYYFIFYFFSFFLFFFLAFSLCTCKMKIPALSSFPLLYFSGPLPLLLLLRFQLFHSPAASPLKALDMGDLSLSVRPSYLCSTRRSSIHSIMQSVSQSSQSCIAHAARTASCFCYCHCYCWISNCWRSSIHKRKGKKWGGDALVNSLLR